MSEEENIPLEEEKSEEKLPEPIEEKSEEKEHIKPKFKCHICGKEYKTFKWLKPHYLNSHNEDIKNKKYYESTYMINQLKKSENEVCVEKKQIKIDNKPEEVSPEVQEMICEIIEEEPEEEKPEPIEEEIEEEPVNQFLDSDFLSEFLTTSYINSGSLVEKLSNRYFKTKYVEGFTDQLEKQRTLIKSLWQKVLNDIEGDSIQAKYLKIIEKYPGVQLGTIYTTSWLSSIKNKDPALIEKVSDEQFENIIKHHSKHPFEY